MGAGPAQTSARRQEILTTSEDWATSPGALAPACQSKVRNMCTHV